MASCPQSFPRSARLLDAAAFEAVFTQGQRLHSPHFRLSLLIHPDPDPAPPRLGIVVSKRVDKRAVQRNRLKRLCRENFRRATGLRAADYVFTAKTGAAEQSAINLRAEIEDLLERAQRRPHTLKPRPLTGTMPRPADPTSPEADS